MGFEHLSWLFTCETANRGICRLNFDEAALLYRAVTNTEGDMLEIGRRFGGSTVLMLEASGGQRGQRMLTSIDFDPSHHPQVGAYFEGECIARRLDLKVCDSRIPLKDRSFGLLFVDGDHSYEGVRADVAAHWGSLRHQHRTDAPLLAVFHDVVPDAATAEALRGGFHDLMAVRRLCDRLIESGCAERAEQAGTMLVVRKIAELPADF